MRLLKDLFYLFYPKLCAICDEKLVENETVLCTICRHDLPLTNIQNFRNNKITDTFYGKVTIEKGYSLLFYRKEGITKQIIHDLKYKGNEEIGIFFGNWIGEILQQNKEMKEVDCIVPVPLHSKKLRQRGYNQVTQFGIQLCNYLQKEYVEDELIRISSTKTQTFKARFERFTNTDTKFLLKNPDRFNNKHILLIDDVITTGATLTACAQEFSKATNCKISIITMAYTE